MTRVKGRISGLLALQKPAILHPTCHTTLVPRRRTQLESPNAQIRQENLKEQAPGFSGACAHQWQILGLTFGTGARGGRGRGGGGGWLARPIQGPGVVVVVNIRSLEIISLILNSLIIKLNNEA